MQPVLLLFQSIGTNKVTENDRIGNTFCGTAEETENVQSEYQTDPYTCCPFGVIGVLHNQ